MRCSVSLDLIEAQQARGWPDFHPEDFCHRCGNRNLSWYVDSSLWNEAWEQVEPGVQSILCPPCFAELWTKATGISMSWELRLDTQVLLARVRRARAGGCAHPDPVTEVAAEDSDDGGGR